VTVEPSTTTLPPAASFFPQRPYNPGAALCFVHVAKAAGTSVRMMIENAFPGDQTYPAASRLAKGAYSKPQRAKEAGDNFRQFRVLSAHAGAGIGTLLDSDANLFTWLREPVDRVISAFFFFVVQERQSGNTPYVARLDTGERVESVFIDWLMRLGADGHSQMAQLVYGMPANGADWRESNPGADLTEAALDALRQCFFVGLMEDQNRSLDALCAITSILPPLRSERRNAGYNRPERLQFTPEEQAKFDQILAPDRAFYALAREIYDRQMAALAERGRTEPALALIGNRVALRHHLLHEEADRTLALTTWKAWDPILGENLDSREKFATHGNIDRRWRWTAPKSDTYLYFRLPRQTAFKICIRLDPATPPDHAEHTTLKLSGERIALTPTPTANARIELAAMVSKKIANGLPQLAEFHLHTAKMLDESKLVPYAGTRMLGLAITEICAVPISPLAYFWGRLGGPRLAGLLRQVQRRLRLPP
jgi:hypothetical protein